MLKVTRTAIVLFHTSTVVSRLSSMYLVTKIQFIIVAMRGGGKSTSFPGFSPTRPSWERGWRESQILRVELSSWLQVKSVYYREHALMAESILDLGLYINLLLQSRQVKRTPQDSFYELIIWKMNPFVVPVTGVKFNSAFCMRIPCEQSLLRPCYWAVNMLRELLCIWTGKLS